MLQEGLWAVSRHPNHLGEQMWWWGVALFAVAAGSPWTIVGTLFNSVCMCQVRYLHGISSCTLQHSAHAAYQESYLTADNGDGREAHV